MRMDEIIETADRLYQENNPYSKRDTPSIVYELVAKWYNSYETTNKEITFYEYCVDERKKQLKKIIGRN